MHEPLKYALSRALNGLRVKHDVESGAPFTGEQNLSMDIVTRPGALSNSSSAEYRNKGILLDVTHTQTRKHRYTCGMAAQPTMDAQPELPRRESASTTLAQDTCPLTSAALNLPP